MLASRKTSSLFSILCCLFLLNACARTVQVNERKFSTSKTTVVLFLVDGLSSPSLQNAINSDSMPATRDFFLSDKAEFTQARATFPTLTYSNIASILTTKNIGDQPIISNHMIVQDRELDFEKAQFHNKLRELNDPINVFARLKAQGKRSASFAYVFGHNASDFMDAGITEGLEYNKHQYEKLDGRLLRNLKAYLDSNRPENWPEFIFVHLVGVDGTAHLYGPNSKESKKYLARLDQLLKPVLQKLKSSEANGRKIISLLTSDHGFIETEKYVPLDKFLKQEAPEITVTNESRFLGLHLPNPQYPIKPLLEKIRRVEGVEFTVLRDRNILSLKTYNNEIHFAYGPSTCANESYSLAMLENDSNWQNASLEFECPGQFDQVVQPYPYLVSNLANFLQAPFHPDALVIAKPHVAFSSGTLGNHGGPTADELFVPLLLRNAQIQSKDPIPTNQLLKILDVIR